jgi:GNAT superfamily N-acetyltransferase
VIEALVIADYRPEDDPEALALDRRCVQGRSLRLSFRRPRFDSRAVAFPEWRILTARRGGALVGTMAAAVKAITFEGRPARAAFFFDLRVLPEARGQGIARALTHEIVAWARQRAAIGYTYTLADNGAVAHLGRLTGGSPVGGYAYLVYPTCGNAEPRQEPRGVGFGEAHDAFLRARGPFDLLPDGLSGAVLGGHVGSWLLEAPDGIAGCSGWDNRHVLAEVVEGVPLALRLLGSATQQWPLRRWRWPRVPPAGEEVRSWYLFDVFATSPSAARDLLRHVASQARGRGIDFCHLVHRGDEPWVKAAGSDVPRLFAPILPYRLLLTRFDSQPPRPVANPYVDIRDL